MNYKQLNKEMKVQVDTLLDTGMSMRQVAKQLGVNVSTVSRYKKRGKDRKHRETNIDEKYEDFIIYFYENYNFAVRSVEVCVETFKLLYPDKPCVTTKQVYNWINGGKLTLKRTQMCYKKRKNRKRKYGMMQHVKWNIDNHTVLPIALRPQHIEDRDELGHLEIDSIIGRKREYARIISIVDRCSRKIWLIKTKGNYPQYINNLIHKYIVENQITVRSITTDNGVEFEALGICAKRLGVKLYKCDPYCSFQRGTNERMNAIVRRFFPKGTPVKSITQENLDFISWQINNMPRKIFNWDTSEFIDQTKL